MVRLPDLRSIGAVADIGDGDSLGFSILMFLGTVWALTYERTRSQIHMGMLAVACSLLLLSTAVSFAVSAQFIQIVSNFASASACCDRHLPYASGLDC
jgi:uncharacterized membrane protein